jgi:hypothetical protein
MRWRREGVRNLFGVGMSEKVPDTFVLPQNGRFHLDVNIPNTATATNQC